MKKRIFVIRQRRYVYVGVAGPAKQAPKTMGLGELFLAGGFLMWPLLILGGVAVFIFFERFWAIRKASAVDMNFMNRIREHICEGRIGAAVQLCRQTNTPIAHMIEKGIGRIGRPLSDVQSSIENVANLEVSKLETGLPILATIAGGAPMIGFLGTVVGMVQAFMNMSQAGGTVDMTVLASGMYVAMVTTVGGLFRLQLPGGAHREARVPDGGQLDRFHGYSEPAHRAVVA